LRYAQVETKPKLGRVVKRIYRNFDHVYLIATHDGRLSALSASRGEHRIFTDLVAIRYTDDKIFLENRSVQVRVRNFKLTKETMEQYLSTPGEVLYDPKPGVFAVAPSENFVWSIARQMFVPKHHT